MNISLLLIIVLIALLFLNFKLKFMMEDPTQVYLSQTNEICEKLKRVNDENCDLKERLKQSQDEVVFLTANINELTSTVEQENLKNSTCLLSIKEINKLKIEMFALQ